MQTHAELDLDLDLFISWKTHASLVLIAQAVFLLQRGQTDASHHPIPHASATLGVVTIIFGKHVRVILLTILEDR